MVPEHQKRDQARMKQNAKQPSPRFGPHEHRLTHGTSVTDNISFAADRVFRLAAFLLVWVCSTCLKRSAGLQLTRSCCFTGPLPFSATDFTPSSFPEPAARGLGTTFHATSNQPAVHQGSVTGWKLPHRAAPSTIGIVAAVTRTRTRLSARCANCSHRPKSRKRNWGCWAC